MTIQSNISDKILMLFFRNQHISVDETFLNNMEDAEKSYSVSTMNYHQKPTHDLQPGKNQGCCIINNKYFRNFIGQLLCSYGQGKV